MSLAKKADFQDHTEPISEYLGTKPGNLNFKK